MNLEFFIARKLIFDRDRKKSISRSILDVAIFGISLGLAVMIVAVAVVIAAVLYYGAASVFVELAAVIAAIF